MLQLIRSITADPADNTKCSIIFANQVSHVHDGILIKLKKINRQYITVNGAQCVFDLVFLCCFPETISKHPVK